ncbi:alanine-phosphoribitol ligase [Pseudoclavibacter endophyticus]|uniref:Monooxygenase n=1 Tax=Pseudoclavibacter endophyticus TaxID=1778590 RepID=A0A6H9WF88_9MICO|nr:styrene monooxygenase/indole monooxygenase family protein [Pseudoclavibacter endophyticus]KAB1649572.1 monooxygenase [Pseudoclavibacter endophyticus]GGA61518.1 alanine-phosphoribitol ligase [Pseudoclavibacter endophyticus]
MTSIGIVGSGVSGLHLGLHLRAQDLPVTIYANKTPEQIAEGRIPGSIAHMHPTRAIEKELGIDHWRAEDIEYIRHWHYNGWGDDRTFYGDFAEPAGVVDYRIYLPRLMRDFTDRGGSIEYREFSREFIEGLTEHHDLVVVAVGKGDLAGIFPKRPEHSPYDAPQRRLAVGLWKGVRHREPNGVEVNIVPGVGELLAIPIYSFSGRVHALLFESLPDGPQAVLADQKYEDDPAAYREATIRILDEFYPTMVERLDRDAFALQDDRAILQGAVTPVMREDFVELPGGKFLLAMGDAHMTVDPVQAQGANSGVYSAKVIADTIRTDRVFDRRFFEKVAMRRRERLESATDWVNTVIRPGGAEQMGLLFSEMVHNQALTDRFTENFSDPVRQYDLIGSIARVEAAIAETAGA